METPQGRTNANVAPLEAVALSEEECLGLLRTSDVGRLAVVWAGKPDIFPVNYAVEGRTVVVRTDPGTKLQDATIGWVAFEVDLVEPDARTGWDVVVRGVGRDVTDGLDALSTRLRSLDFVPWESGSKSHWIAIVDPVISGRRLVRATPSSMIEHQQDCEHRPVVG